MSQLKPLSGTLAHGGVAHFWRDTEEGGEIVSMQDVGAALDRNRALYDSGDGYNADRSMRRVASIPPIVIQKWLIEDGLDVWNPDHRDRLMRKLNDPDWRYLRTAQGRLGATQDGGFR